MASCFSHNYRHWCTSLETCQEQHRKSGIKDSVKKKKTLQGIKIAKKSGSLGWSFWGGGECIGVRALLSPNTEEVIQDLWKIWTTHVTNTVAWIPQKHLSIKECGFIPPPTLLQYFKQDKSKMLSHCIGKKELTLAEFPKTICRSFLAGYRGDYAVLVSKLKRKLKRTAWRKFPFTHTKVSLRNPQYEIFTNSLIFFLIQLKCS